MVSLMYRSLPVFSIVTSKSLAVARYAYVFSLHSEKHSSQLVHLFYLQFLNGCFSKILFAIIHKKGFVLLFRISNTVPIMVPAHNLHLCFLFAFFCVALKAVVYILLFYLPQIQYKVQNGHRHF